LENVANTADAVARFSHCSVASLPRFPPAYLFINHNNHFAAHFKREKHSMRRMPQIAWKIFNSPRPQRETIAQKRQTHRHRV